MDSNNFDFTHMWQQQKVSNPDIKGLYNKINQFKKKGFQKIVIANVCLIATCVFIIFIWYKYQPLFITTKIGICLAVVAMIVYLFTYNKQFTIYTSIDSTQSSSEYLKSLLALIAKQKYLHSTLMSLYFLLLTFGICLYLVEYTLRMTIIWAIFTYGITLLWIGFNWFYIRPKMIRKQQVELEELIFKFELLDKQLAEE